MNAVINLACFNRRNFGTLCLGLLLSWEGTLHAQGPALIPILPPISPTIQPILPPILPQILLPLDTDFPVQFGQSWRFVKGLAEPSTNTPVWFAPEFDETNWGTTRLPLASGINGTGGTLLRDMRGGYSTVYLRKSFQVEDIASLNQMTLHVRASDGYVVWINGIEVGRGNVSAGDLTYTNTAAVNGASQFNFTDFPVTNLDSTLRSGTNQLAVLGLSGALNDSAFIIDASLEIERDRTPPIADRTVPESGSVVRLFNTFEVLFSEPVRGVDAADLLINGVAATNRVVVAPDDYVFEFASPPNGPVELTFRADPGITDLSRALNPLAPVAWSVQVDSKAPPDGLQISEFMADNAHTLRDDDGDHSDWIEIQNTGNAAASLENWGLTVDATKPLAWQFPRVVVPKGGFVLVYASGKNRSQANHPLHTNFKLGKSGGYLALATPLGEPVSAFTAYPAQSSDVSYGRVPGNAESIGFFAQPTPNARNSSSGSGFAPTVSFSESSQTFRGALTVSLATADPNAVIRYTTNHLEPNGQSLLYTGPLAVTNTLEIRARSFVSSLLPGPVHSETFMPLADDVVEFTSDLPVFLINDFNAGRPGLGQATGAHLQVFAAGTNLFGNVPLLTTRATIAARGSSTAGEAKVSMKLELQDEFGNDKSESLLGLPKDSDWILYGPDEFEPILIHNPFAHQLSRDIGRYSPRTRFVVVYLITRGNGPVQALHYFGIYALEEQIKPGPHRVDIDKLSPEVTRPDLITGGYLLKIDRGGSSDGYIGTPQQTVLVTDPKGFELNTEQYQYLNTYFAGFDQALYSTNFRDPIKGYRAYVDVPSWIDHHLLNVLTFNVDALRLSAYFYKPRGEKLHFGPLWDFDRSLRSTDGRDISPRTWQSTSGDLGTDFFNYTWWDRLFKDLEFFQQYIDRYDELRTNQFGLSHLYELVDTLTTEVRNEQPRELKKWHIAPRGGFNGEIRDLKLWLSNRLDFIDTQFVRPPVLVRGGANEEVDFAARTNAVIYYTLDGSDPRLLGGGVSSTAQVFSGTQTFLTNTVVTARAYNVNHKPRVGAHNPPLKSLWSAPVRRTVVVQPIPLVISEIMYHPADPGPGVDPQDLEFVEFLNRGDQPLDLRGWVVGGGIQYSFEAEQTQPLGPNERRILVHNRAVFAQFYPGVTNVAGAYTNSLGNGGDRLIVTGRLGEPVLDFRFEGNWETSADGGGKSLVLAYEGTPVERLGQKEVWKASAFRGGSPGTLDAVTVPNMALKIGRDPLGITLRFNAARARPYRVWTRSDLTSDPWRLVQGLSALDQDGMRTISLPSTEQPQLFRLTSP